MALGWEPNHIRFHTPIEDLWPQYMILEACWDGLKTISFGLSQVYGHGSQNMETMTLRTLTTVGLLYFIMCEGPHK